MITKKEQEYGNSLIAFYSTPTNKDQAKINAFIYGDDKNKIIMIKTFLKEIINPHTVSELENYQSKVEVLSSEVLSITNYTK
jgi:hypothetical protein